MSNIDPTKPIYGEPTTQSVRDNFTIAKNEIETLQELVAAINAGGPYLPLSGGMLTGAIEVEATTAPLVVTANTAFPIPYRPNTLLNLVGANNQNARLNIDSFGAVAGGSIISGRFAMGTPDNPGLGGPMNADRGMMVLSGIGYGTTGYAAASRVAVRLNSAELWSDTAQGTYISFMTTKRGTINTVEVARLTDAGALQVGSVATTGGPLILSGTGAPTMAAPNSSLYLRADGATGTRQYINQGGGTTWAPVPGV